MKKESLIIYGIIALFIISIIVPLTSSGPERGSGTPNNGAFSQAFTISDAQSSIAILKIFGPIGFNHQSSVFQAPQSVETWIQALKNLENNDALEVLILRINSPGGTVGASQELYEAIQQFKAKTKVPVIASIADSGTSGAYWISLAADHIFANPGSIVGNIGVILGNINVEELAENIGVKYNVYKSGPYKDLLSSWRKNTKNETALIQAMVDDIHAQFVATLMDGRDMSEKDALALAQGQVFTGTQAKSEGLIDHVGSLYAAIEFAKETYDLPEDTSPTTIKGNPFEQWIDSFGAFTRLSTHPLLHLLQQSGQPAVN